MISATVRIAVEFSEFLEKHQQLEDAEADEVDYTVNTIRSGMDCFFSCEEHFRVVAERHSKNFSWTLHSEFAALRKEYLKVFREMRSGLPTFIARLDTLLYLVQLQLQFMTANFHRRDTD